MNANVLSPKPSAGSKCRICGANGIHSHFVTVSVERAYDGENNYYLHLPVRVPYCDCCFDRQRRRRRLAHLIFWPVFTALVIATEVYSPELSLLLAVPLLFFWALYRSLGICKADARESEVVTYLTSHGWKGGASESDFNRVETFTAADLTRQLSEIERLYGYVMVDTGDDEAIDYRYFAEALFDNLSEVADFSG